MNPTSRLLHFVYTQTFEATARDILSDDDRRRLEDALLEEPRLGIVLQGTGGFRKMRFALPGRGKRGSARVVYYYVDRYGRVYLVAFFAKNEKENLSQAERNELRRIAQAFEEEEA